MKADREESCASDNGQNVTGNGDGSEQESDGCVASSDPCAAKALRPWRAGDDQKQVQESRADERSEQTEDEDERKEQQEELQTDQRDDPREEGIPFQAGEVSGLAQQLHPGNQFQCRIGQRHREDEEDQAVQKDAQHSDQAGEEKRPPPARIDSGSSKEPAWRGCQESHSGKQGRHPATVLPLLPRIDDLDARVGAGVIVPGVHAEHLTGAILMADARQQRTAAVRDVGAGAGALVVGVAAASAFNEFVPEGHRPEDVLPGARSVVVAGNQGPTAGAWRSPDHRVMEITGYDFRENVAVHVMCDYIEREHGHRALQAPSLPTAGHNPPMSMMLAAVLAGLGTRSLAANIILHPRYGLLYYAALVTTLDLEPDHPLEEDVCPSKPCIQMYEKLGTTPCLASCPKEEGGCLDGALDENGRISYSYYDRERCTSRSMNFGIGSIQKSLVQITTEEDRERRKSMIYSDFFSQSLSSLSYYKESVAQCFECMRVCPVGMHERRLQ